MGSNNEGSGLENERQKLNDTMAAVEKTEGFPLLTERQQRIIGQSLYIQARSERVINSETNEDASYVPDQKYRLSKDLVSDWYCHAAIAALEQERGFDVDSAEVPKDFFRTEYYDLRSLRNVEDLIENFKFPCVVHIMASKPDNYDEGYKTAHSCLALGHDQNGKILVWEKQKRGEPFQIVTLDEVFDEFTLFKDIRYDKYWGVRDLKTRVEPL